MNYKNLQIIMSILLTLTYCYLVINGTLDFNLFENIFIMIISFFFGANDIFNTKNKN